MNPTQQQALNYVINTNGGATRAIFIEDHEPIGEALWTDLLALDLVYEGPDGRIYARQEGTAKDACPDCGHRVHSGVSCLTSDVCGCGQ